MFKLFLFRLTKLIWVLFATAVVSLAVVVSLIKYTLPYANDYKYEIEAYLYTELGANITFGSFESIWQSSGPSLVVNDTVLTPSASAPLDISVREVRVSIDFWQSLLQQKLVTQQFSLTGIRAKVNSEVFFKVSSSSDDSQFVEGISHLFLTQVQTFSIDDSLVIVSHENGRIQNYQIDQFSWMNSGNRHQGQGSLYVDGFSDNSLSMAVDLYGQRRSDIFGQVYVQASEMEISSWLTQMVGDHVSLERTQANFQVWGEIKNGLVTNAMMDISDTAVFWKKAEQDNFLAIEKAKVQLWNNDGAWLLFGNHIQLKTHEDYPPLFNFTLLSFEEYSQFFINKVDLSSLSQMFSLFSVTKDINLLANANVTGTLQELQMQWSEHQPLSAIFSVDNVSFLPPHQQGQAYLGIEGLKVNGYWLDDQAWLKIEGKEGVVNTQDTFTKPLEYQALSIDVHIQDFASSQVITVPQIAFYNNDIHIKSSMQYISSERDYMQLYTEIQGPKQGQIPHYLPQYLIPPLTYQFLQQGIKSGKSELIQIAMTGYLDSLPFSLEKEQQDQGRLLIKAGIEDAVLDFHSDWPELTIKSGELWLKNDELLIKPIEAAFSKMKAGEGVSARIPLGTQQTNLYLDIDSAEVNLEDFHYLVRSTPLYQEVGEVFEFVTFTGVANANVNILLPLDSSEALAKIDNPQVFSVSGVVIPYNSKLYLPDLDTEITELIAQVEFVDDSFQVSEAKGKYLGLPVEFNVVGKRAKSNHNNSSNDLLSSASEYHINMRLQADWSQALIAQQHDLPVMNYFSGDIATELDLSVDIMGNDYQYLAQSYSNLTQAGIDIIEPLNKPIGQESGLSVQVYGDQNTNNIVAQLDELVHFQAELPNELGVIDKAILSLGREKLPMPAKGFEVQAEFDEAKFEPGFEFVLDLLSSLPQTESTENSILGSPDKIGANIQALNIVDQQWHNVSMDGVPQEDYWIFSVGAQETLANIKVYDDTLKGVEINASFLNIASNNNQDSNLNDSQLLQTQAETDLNQPSDSLLNSSEFITGFPPVHFVCEVCHLDKSKLGRIELNLKSEGSNLIIESASLNEGRNHINLSGIWQGNESAGTTQLQGTIKSKNFGRWMKSFDFNTGIEESDAQINVDINWQNAPYLVDLSRLNGDVHIRFGDGYLSEVSDKGSRIFSLFSLDSLYRKLKLDFKDVFQKGLFYNSIKGNINIENGVAVTDNIRMDGVAGNMEMKGYTDLNTSQLDYNIVFKPKVTSSLGVLSWLAFEPTIGLAVFALDKVIESADVVSEVRLKATGDLSNPDVREVKRFTKKVKVPQTPEQSTSSVQNEAKEPQQERSSDNLEAMDSEHLHQLPESGLIDELEEVVE